MSREANSTIKGYLYQFIKSLEKILTTSDEVIYLEGAIEDIDLVSENGDKSAIQCKYYECENFSYSLILPAILEIYTNYLDNKFKNNIVDYYLYFYTNNNNRILKKEEILNSIKETTNKDYIIKFLSKIYEIDDNSIKEKINKNKKSKEDKTEIYDYFIKERENLKLIEDFDDFFSHFHYQCGETYDDLIVNVKKLIGEMTNDDSSVDILFGNAISKIADLSSKRDLNERKVNPNIFKRDLVNEKNILFTKWSKTFLDFNNYKRTLKSDLKPIMNNNVSVRAFYFTGVFNQMDISEIANFILIYLNKFYKKPIINKKPVFIFDNQNIVFSLCKYLGKSNCYCNTGIYCNEFKKENLFTDDSAPKNYKAYVLSNDLVDEDIISSMNVNFFFMLGEQISLPYSLNQCQKICLDIDNIQDLNYVLSL